MNRKIQLWCLCSILLLTPWTCGQEAVELPMGMTYEQSVRLEAQELIESIAQAELKVKTLKRKLLMVQRQCAHPIDSQKMDYGLYGMHDIICLDCRQVRAGWLPRKQIVEDALPGSVGRWRDTTPAEDERMAEYVRRVEKAMAERARKVEGTNGQQVGGSDGQD